jgi:hypothetical protein
MNEQKVLELLMQAREECVSKLIMQARAASFSRPATTIAYDKIFRLTELIVRECLDWCNAHSRDDGTAQKIAESIKKEFGVE